MSVARRRALGALGLVAALPLVHVAVESARIALRGDLVYDAEVDAGAGIARGLEVLYDWWPEAMPQTARNLMLCAVALVVVASIVRRRLDVLALGALASGGLTIVFAAQSGFAASRYYIPLYALVAVAGCLSLARLPEALQAAGVLVVFFAFIPATETRAEVSRWSDEEQQHSEIVALVSALERSGCTVATDGTRSRNGSRATCPRGAARPRATSAPAATEAPTSCSRHPGTGASRFSRHALRAASSRSSSDELLGVHRCARLRADAAELLAAARFQPVTP